MKLLIAYDGSPGAEVAVKDLVRAGVPKRGDARIVSFADVWLPPAPSPDEGIFSQPRSRAAAYDKASEVLRRATKTAIQGAELVHQMLLDWNVTNCAKPDSPAWGILAEARRWHADLIAIGSHGRTPLERFFLGSVSYKVAAEAICSVRVVRPHNESGHPPVRLMIGIDGSKDSLNAVQQVAQRNWGAGTQVDLVTVIDPKLTSETILKSGLLRKAEELESTEISVQRLLEKSYEALTRQELVVQCHILEGDPKRTLLHKAEDWRIDCIFLGARGTEHAERLYLGTVASAICTRAHCTVEIVRGSPTPG
jgi:nucleotide-binding universal stress UspA family protein